MTQTDTHPTSSLMLELALGRLAAVRRDVPFQICHRFGDVCIGTRNALFFSIRFFATRRGICRRVLSAISSLSSNASSSRSITLRPRPRPRQIERTSCLICDNQPMAMFRSISEIYGGPYSCRNLGTKPPLHTKPIKSVPLTIWQFQPTTRHSSHTVP